MVGDVAAGTDEPVAPVQPRPERRGPGECRRGARRRRSAFRSSSSNSATRSSVSHSPAMYDSPKPSLPRVASRRKKPRSWIARRTGRAGAEAPHCLRREARPRACRPRGRRAPARALQSRLARAADCGPAPARRGRSRAHAPLARHERRLVVERHALEPESQRLEVDQRGHLQRLQRVAEQQRCERAVRQLAAASVQDRGQRRAARRRRGRGSAPTPRRPAARTRTRRSGRGRRTARRGAACACS